MITVPVTEASDAIVILPIVDPSQAATGPVDPSANVDDRIKAIYQRLQEAQHSLDNLPLAKQGITLVETHLDRIKSKQATRLHATHIYYFFAEVIFNQKILDQFDKALGYLKKAEPLALPYQMIKISILEADITALRNRSETINDSCDTCYAIGIFKQQISWGDDKQRAYIHRRLAELIAKRIREKHHECFPLDCTPPIEEGELEEEKKIELSEQEKQLPPLIEALFEKMTKTGNFKDALPYADKAILLFEQYPSLAKKDLRLQSLERSFLLLAAKAIDGLKRESLYGKALQYLDRVIKISPTPSCIGMALVPYASILKERNIPKDEAGVCSKCKAIEILSQAPERVDDKTLQSIHEKLAELFEDRVAQNHSDCFTS